MNEVSKLPTVSIIVVNWNGKKWLKNCFESLENLNYPRDKYEVIMVDNASTDDSIEFTRKNFPWIKILKLDKNYGFADGNNKGVEIAKGEYIAFLNNDTYVDKEWLSELIKHAIKNPKIICSSIMLDYDDKEKVISNVIKGTIFGLNGFVESGKKYPLQNLSPKFSFYPVGSGMLIRKKVFLSLGGFDSLYFMYGEDESLGWKAWLFGYKVIVVPCSVHWHKVRASSSNCGRSPMYIYFLWRNNMINILKYPQLQNVIKIQFLFFIVSLGAFFLFFTKKQFSLIAPIFKAYFSFLKLLPDVLKERKTIQSKRKISDKELREKGVYLNFSGSIRELINFAGNFEF